MRFALLAAAACGAGMIDAQTLQYPVTRTTDVVDDYHGIKVADPYRWLEDTDSSDTAKWVEAQNAVTSALIEYTLSRLNLFLDMELLFLEPTGIRLDANSLEHPESAAPAPEEHP